MPFSEVVQVYINTVPGSAAFASWVAQQAYLHVGTVPTEISDIWKSAGLSGIDPERADKIKVMRIDESLDKMSCSVTQHLRSVGIELKTQGWYHTSVSSLAAVCDQN